MHAAVPVFHDSNRHFELDVSGFQVTHAVFAPGTSIAPHRHERDIVALMLAGSFDVTFRGRQLGCGPMSVHTEPAGECHHNLVGRQGAELVVIQPDPARRDEQRPFRRLLDDIIHLEHGGLRLLGRRLLRELSHQDACTPLAAESLILEILVVLTRSASKEPTGVPPAWLEQARDLVHASGDRFVTTGEIATAVGVHPATLVRFFKAHYRLPLGTYARALRLDAAAQRLASTSLPTARIAVEAGFVDQSHFTRRFKQQYGVTPEQYRRASAGS